MRRHPPSSSALVGLCERHLLSVRTTNALLAAGHRILYSVPRTAEEIFQIVGVGERALRELDAIGWVRLIKPRRNKSSIPWDWGRKLWLLGVSQPQIARSLGITTTALWVASKRERWPVRVLVYAFPDTQCYAPRLPGVPRLMAMTGPPPPLTGSPPPL